MNDVWGYAFLGNSNLVDVYIRYVRKKLTFILPHYPNNPRRWLHFGDLAYMKIKTKASLLSFVWLIGILLPLIFVIYYFYAQFEKEEEMESLQYAANEIFKQYISLRFASLRIITYF